MRQVITYLLYGVAFLVAAVLVLAVVGLVVAVVVSIARSFFVLRHAESDGPGAGWTPTDEVFRDPGTGRTMRVWVDGTGDRNYVAEQPG